MGRFSESTIDSSGYPRGPGFKDGGTSRDAANAISGAVEDLRLRVLAELPGAAEQIAERLGLRRDQIAPRLTELTKETPPRAVKTKARYRNKESGLSAAVYEKVNQGEML
jgi:hypothetical protein